MSWKSFKYTEKKALQWEKIRSKGKAHWVFVVGLLYQGGSLFLLTTLLGYFHKPATFQMANLVFNAVLWTCFGILWGILSWNLLERQYLNYKGKV